MSCKGDGIHYFLQHFNTLFYIVVLLGSVPSLFRKCILISYFFNGFWSPRLRTTISVQRIWKEVSICFIGFSFKIVSLYTLAWFELVILLVFNLHCYRSKRRLRIEFGSLYYSQFIRSPLFALQPSYITSPVICTIPSKWSYAEPVCQNTSS